MNKDIDIKVLERLVKERFDLQPLLQQLNPDARYQYGRPCFCPFHDNTDTPAAALYQGKAGDYDSLYCFSEQRQYTSVDALKKMGRNVFDEGAKIWKSMSKYEQENYLQHIGHVNYANIFGNKTAETDYESRVNDQQFASGTITLTTYLKNKIIKELS